MRWRRSLSSSPKVVRWGFLGRWFPSWLCGMQRFKIYIEASSTWLRVPHLEVSEPLCSWRCELVAWWHRKVQVPTSSGEGDGNGLIGSLLGGIVREHVLCWETLDRLTFKCRCADGDGGCRGSGIKQDAEIRGGGPGKRCNVSSMV
jgi:hypothetical protein